MKLHDQTGNQEILCYRCPCGNVHCLPIVPLALGDPLWEWNGSWEKPTFTPSVLYREWGGEQGTILVFVCHSYVTDGRIQFLADSTHAFAGQTVEMLPWHKEEGF